MKKLIFFLCLGIAVWSCDDNSLPAGDCIQVRLVDELCGTAVLQVVNSSFYGIAQKSWTDSNNQVWSNVFTTNLACMMDQVPANGDSFFVDLVSNLPEDMSDCVTCLALFANPPEVFHYVSIQTNCAGVSPIMD